MKKTVAIAIVALLLVAAQLPPALPASIYGDAGKSGFVTVTVGDQIVARTKTIMFDGRPVYVVNVLVDDFTPGTLAEFRNGQYRAIAPLYSGTNVRVDLGLVAKKK